MRAKRNKEVNIFSASVVDLFASGLGVFLIVAIIALSNQKKEDQVTKTEETSEQSPQKRKEIEILQDKLSELKEKIVKLQEENIKIKATAYSLKEEKQFENKLSTKQKVDAVTTKSALVIDKYKRDQEVLGQENNELKEKLEKLQQQMEQLKREQRAQINNIESEQKELGSLKKFEFSLGKKIQLTNVQFYAGTNATIEPFASQELSALATQLKDNPNVKIEVSGHIFLTKTEIDKGQVGDDTNLSGRRASAVCDSLIKLGIEPERLRCVGYGGRRPLFLTDDEYSREAQLNRRVEIEVTAK